MALHKLLIERVIWPEMEKRKGNHIRQIQRALEKSQYEDVAALQRERLTELLLHCKAHVPVYENILPEESAIRDDPYAALRCVELLSKKAFQAQADAHLAQNIPQSARIANCTGGSTGEPVRFFMTRPQVESYEAARWRGLGWYGITQGSRSVMLWGSPIELSQQAQIKNRLKEELLKNRRILSAYHLNGQQAEKYVAFLNRYKPEYLYGYASILTAFAQMLEKQGLSLKIRLKAVVSTSETLEPWQEQLLSRVEGRQDDLLIGHGGTLVHGNVIGQILRPVPGVSAFQFRQKSKEHAELLIVRTSPDETIDEQGILAQLKKALPDTEIQIRYVDAILPTPSGKMRYAIRECPLPEG